MYVHTACPQESQNLISAKEEPLNEMSVTGCDRYDVLL